MHPRKVNTARKIEISRLRGPIVVTPTEREVEPSPISGGSPQHRPLALHRALESIDE